MVDQPFGDDRGNSFDLTQGLSTLLTKLGAYTEAVEAASKNVVAAMDMQARFAVGRQTPAGHAVQGVVSGVQNSFTAGQTTVGTMGRQGQPIGTLGGVQQGVVQAAAGALAGYTRTAPPTGSGGSGGQGGGTGGGGGTGSGPGPSTGNPPPPGGGSGGGGGTGGPGGGAGRPGGGGPSGGPAPAGTGATTGLMNMIPFVGTVGKVIEEFRSQRDKNAYYQSLQGGSNLDAMTERFNEEGYRWRTMGMFGEEEARQAFKGVTRLGYGQAGSGVIGNNRDTALDFVYHAKSSYGAGVSESLQNLQAVSEDSRVSLEGLNNALKAVSDTAGTAGVNAEMLRNHMVQYTQTAINQNYGGGSVGFAQGVAQQQASYGRAFQDTSFAGRATPMYEYRVASAFGMTNTQYNNIQRSNPVRGAAMRSETDLQLINMLLGPAAVQWINQAVTQYGGKAVVISQPEIVAQIADDFYQAFPNLDENILPGQIKTFAGVDVDRNTAVRWIIENIAGNTELASAKKQQAAVAPKKTTAAGLAPFKDQSGGDTYVSGPMGTYTVKGTGTAHTQTATEKQYVEGAQKSGVEDPIIEALLKNTPDQDSSKVSVLTSKGQREMSLQDALKFFPNEVKAGKVTFTSGAKKGETTSGVAGLSDPTADWKGEYNNTSNAARGSAYTPPTTGTTPNTTGTTLVDLTPEAKQLLKLLPGDTGAAAAAGTPPVVPQTGSR